VRAKVSEGVVQASAAKATVAENLAANADNLCAGVNVGLNGASTLTCVPGADVTEPVVLGVTVATSAGNILFNLAGTLATNGTTWSCTTDADNFKYVPSECRKES
jgi:type IV pilus assembly protein PilA